MILLIFATIKYVFMYVLKLLMQLYIGDFRLGCLKLTTIAWIEKDAMGGFSCGLWLWPSSIPILDCHV